MNKSFSIFLILAFFFGCAKMDTDKAGTRDLKIAKPGKTGTSSNQVKSEVNSNDTTGNSVKSVVSEEGNSNLKTNSPVIPGPDPDPLFKASDIEAGFKWLATSKSTAKSYKIKVSTYETSGAIREELISGISSGRHVIEEAAKFDIRKWTKRPSHCAYELEHEMGGKLWDVALVECLDSNRYGIENCPSPVAKFLGTKDIGAFKNSFGVLVTCSGTLPRSSVRHQASIGYPYISIREIWFHKDSSQYRQKVKEASALFKSFESPWTLEKVMTSEISQQVQMFSYENYTAASSGPILDVWTSYSVSGAILNPGIYSGAGRCRVSKDRPTQLQVIILPFNTVVSANYASPFELKFIDAQWSSNVPDRNGKVAGGGQNRNRDPYGGYTSLPKVNYNVEAGGEFFKVSLADSNKLMQTVTPYGYGYTTMGSYSPFYCVNPNVLTPSSVLDDFWEGQ